MKRMKKQNAETLNLMVNCSYKPLTRLIHVCPTKKILQRNNIFSLPVAKNSLGPSLPQGVGGNGGSPSTLAEC